MSAMSGRSGNLLESIPPHVESKSQAAPTAALPITVANRSLQLVQCAPQVLPAPALVSWISGDRSDAVRATTRESTLSAIASGTAAAYFADATPPGGTNDSSPCLAMSRK